MARHDRLDELQMWNNYADAFFAVTQKIQYAEPNWVGKSLEDFSPKLVSIIQWKPLVKNAQGKYLNIVMKLRVLDKTF